MRERSEDIVIAGLACRLPESNNTEEFWSHLINREDMITEDGRRWTPELHGLPKRSGKLKDIKSFDANFFSVHAKQAHKMDPQLRLLLELTQEALIDAGVDPQSVRNSRTGVFVGASTSDAAEANTHVTEDINGYGLVGGCRAMLSNRVSFSFDFKGPSFTMDTACSSSLLAMDCAIQAIKAGTCDAAIVGGVNLSLKPNGAVDFLRLNMLSAEGMCKTFDESGYGYVRAEGAVCTYLVKRHAAKRVYAEVINSKTNSDGYKSQGVTYPSGAIQKQLLQEVYAESGVNPSEVSYVEAHGTGTKAGDPEEANAITDVFCEGRKDPLLIGSVKSNMGHAEPASGLAGLTKVLLSMQHGVLPPNLHFQNPNPKIPGLLDGRLKVVTEATAWDGGYVGINSFGFGGSNVHLILKSPSIDGKSLLKNDGLISLPVSGHTERISLPICGRTEEAVQSFMELARKNSSDVNLISLMREIAFGSSTSFPFRGYVVLGSERNLSDVQKVPPKDVPLWYVFAGMGAQWHGMGKDMMTIPAFEESIKKSSTYLKEYGFDLEDLILNSTEETYKSLLNSFVGTAAIQVALVDCLTVIGAKPDGIIGHSVGELGCAYADGSFTAEEVIKAAYWRGRCVVEANLPAGIMAAIGMTWEEAKRRCPPGIIPACHNAINTVTISGEKHIVEVFLEELRDEKIFVREVNTSGIAFHSHYMAEIAPVLLSSLQKFIFPKRRSKKWVSTSIPEDRWDCELAQYSSAEYHVNNLASPVLFQEALRKIPTGAVVVEIAPHCLLKGVLKRSLTDHQVVVPLMKKADPNNVDFFLSNVGNVYMSGVNVNPASLTCASSYPVPVSTPSIAPYMRWDHSQEWDVATADQFESMGGGGAGSSFEFEIDISNESEDNYLEGHCIDGRVLFPATGYLVLAWKALARKMGLIQDKLAVGFEEVEIQRATILSKTEPTTLTVFLLPASNKFEVSEGDNLSVCGKIFALDEKELRATSAVKIPTENDDITLSAQCIYKELRLRGYDYGPTFQGIETANNEGNFGKLIWDDNWTVFLDTMLQMSVLNLPGRSLRLPTRLRSLKIDPSSHLKSVVDGFCNVHIDSLTDRVVAGGVTLQGLHATVAPKKLDNQSPTLECYSFVPYMDNEDQDTGDVKSTQTTNQTADLNVMLDIVIENVFGDDVSVCELNATSETLYKDVVSHGHEKPLLRMKYIATDNTNEELRQIEKSATDAGVEVTCWNPSMKPPSSIGKIDLVLALNRFHQGNEFLGIVRNIKSVLNSQGFLLLRDVSNNEDRCLDQEGFVEVSNMESRLKLYRLARQNLQTNGIVIELTDSHEWLHKLQTELNENNVTPIWIKSEVPTSGIVGMTNCLRKESGGNRIRCLFNADEERGDLMAEFEELRRRDLVMNVYKHDKLGSFRHLPMGGNDSPLEVTEHAYVNILSRGDLSSLRWITSPLKYASENEGDMELCKVYYTSLNFRDIMLATGKLPPDALPGNMSQQDCILGMEFSGRNRSGKRIMGLLPAQALATSVLADRRFTWEVPDEWSLLEAATVPVVYSTAYYALIMRARLAPGQSVLIHSGSGGVGQAAIAICLSMRCKVYTTVGTEEKRKYLLKTFPGLQTENIGNSRDLTFEDMVMQRTNGNGVDVVLNSLSGAKLQASVRCLARHGCFLEIGKFDLSNNSPLGMSVFLKNVSFHGILLDAIFEDGNRDWEAVASLVTAGIRSGAVRPLKTSVFERDEIEPAFRFMAQGKHIGKVVINVRKEVAESSPLNLSVQARSLCDPKKSYLITGGLGGFGLELTDWLIRRGARCILLTSRRGIRTGYQSRMVKKWRDSGVNVSLSTSDVSTKEGTEKAIKESQSLAPLGGIFHLAVVLRDGLFENQTVEMFSEACKPKYRATLLLDDITRRKDIAESMHWFVVFSSVVSGRGNAGQTNYGFANSAMERICEKRVDDGLPGTAIQWGAIGDVGIVQESMKGTNQTVIGGTLPQRITNCLDVLDKFLQQGHPVTSSYVLAAKESALNSDNSNGDIVSSLGRILGAKDASTINPDSTLEDLGLDSLMSVEVKHMLERTYNLNLKSSEIQLATINSLKERLSTEEAPVDNKETENTVTTEQLIDLFEIPNYTERTVSKLNNVTSGTPIFLIHNIYGTIDPLLELGGALNHPSYGVQFTNRAPITSIQDLSSFYIREMKKVEPSAPYVIAGYSFGAAVAIEMAIQLEEAKESVKLILLDGSQMYVATHSHHYKNRRNILTKLETSAVALSILANRISVVDEDHMSNTLKPLRSIESMIHHAATMISNTNDRLDKSRLVSYLTFFVRLLEMGESYEAQRYFAGDALLIRAKTCDNMGAEMGEDLGLKLVCSGDVKVEYVRGDHTTMLKGENVKAVLNLVHNIENL